MKKIIATTFCTLMLCGLLLTVGINMVVAQDYERNSYITQVTPTLDGEWTSPDEWTDGDETWIGTDVVFRSTHDGDMTRWIVEFLTDTTDDSGDYLQFCFDIGQYEDSELTLGHNNAIQIVGHTELVKFNVGDGEWVDWAGSALEVEWANSLSTSSASSTPHWIYEIQIDKTTATIPWEGDWNFLLGVFDQSNSGDGLQTWPPNADTLIPAEYGTENSLPEAIPEGLTFAVMALLTTVSMLVGYKYFIKRKETK